MKIALLNANRMGIGTYHRALNFGRELARRGHDVTLMTVSNTQRFRAAERMEQERFRIIECPNWLDELLPWHASGLLDIGFRIRELWSGDYDVVYAFEYQPNVSVPALLLRPLRRFTLISDWCDWHAGASYHFGGYRWAHAIDRYFEELIRHRADFVTTINETLRARARAIGIDATRLAIVGEGVDPQYIAPQDKRAVREQLQLPHDARIVATIRDANRSAELLCDAIATLYDDIHLLFIGGRPEAIRAYADRAGISHRLITPGRVSDAELPLYLGAADVHALPLQDNLTNRGRWPHKLGDMLASRRPVIVSRAGEFPEMLEKRNCAVIANYDSLSFRQAISAVLSAPAAFDEIAQRGRHLIETELNWTEIGRDLDQAIRDATALASA